MLGMMDISDVEFVVSSFEFVLFLEGQRMFHTSDAFVCLHENRDLLFCCAYRLYDAH